MTQDLTHGRRLRALPNPWTALLYLALAVSTGCGGPRTRPAEIEVPGYRALQEQFQGIDLTPLQDRRIVLDPGHGGFFTGAVGANGLTEAEVNLGVGLYLRGLLEWAGAEVHLTRTADYDFLTPADSSLVSDLAFRVSMTDSLQPDVFLSLHHNSVASLDRTVNETQTYYPLGAEGASLDLARAIHRHLVLNLEISPARILPGNFHVLRNATVPAVLGEPAMISHPVIEGRLSLASSQRLEAEAYFLGLLDYFSQGSPRWAGAPVDTVVVAADQDAIRVSWVYLRGDFRRDGERRRPPGPDPDSFRLTLDGAPTPFHLGPGVEFVHWQRPRDRIDLPAVLELHGRNLLGRATPIKRTVLVPSPARRIDLSLFGEAATDGQDFVGVRWSVPGIDPLPAGNLVFSPDLSLPIAGGTSGAALMPAFGGTLEDITFRPNDPDLPWRSCRAERALIPAPWQLRLLSTPAAGATWSLKNLPGTGLPGVLADQTSPLVPYLPGEPVWVNVPGLLPLVDPAPADPDTARTIAAGDRIWATEPVVPALLGRVIVIDPAGGGSDPDGTGPLGARGATLNLETAELTRRLLEGCGAVVHLTRTDETDVPADTKVRLAGAVGADLFVTIGRSGRPDLMTAHYHPGSAVGQRWAELFLKARAGLAAPGDSVAVSGSWNYLLRHTACPALEIRLPAAATPRQEMRLTSRGWLRAESRALLNSIAAVLTPAEVTFRTLDPVAVMAALPTPPVPDRVDWARLDGNLSWSPVPTPASDIHGKGLSSGEGRTLFSYGDPGLPDLTDRHTLEIHSNGSWQLWLLERSGQELAGRLLMQSP